MKHIGQYLLKNVLPMLIGASLVFTGASFAHTSLSGFNPSHPLLVNYRQDLALCVASDNRADVLAVRNAIEQVVKRHSLWEPVFKSHVVRIEFGCPSTPYLVKFPNASTIPVIPRVQVASEYRVFVHVMSQDQLQALIGNTERRVWPQEALCIETDCSTVTSEVYVSSSEVGEPATLGPQLLKALGLENPYTSSGAQTVPADEKRLKP